jgi:hypothetical protein
MKFKHVLIISIILHALLLFYKMEQSCEQKKGKTAQFAQQRYKIYLGSKKQEQESQKEAKKKDGKGALKPIKRVATRRINCKYGSYVGIGVSLMCGEKICMVAKVIKGGPADLAGVLEGDTWYKGAMAYSTLKPGTQVTIPVGRGGEIIELTAIIEEICREKEKED